MTATDMSLIAVARDWRTGWQDRWQRASSETRTRVQVAVFLSVVIVAYHYSLSTLLQSLKVDTPLAYIGLVPFIALGLAVARRRPLGTEPAIYDRQVDYIVGVPLLATALAINWLLPRRLSAMFWLWRIDLLSLPFFVAGVATIVFGIRTVWRQRLAIVYLFLVWPVPYSVVLLRDLTTFTHVTLGALHTVNRYVHLANPMPSSDGSLFTVVHHGTAFQISVVSACSGVNGMVGFLLVGIAFGAIVKGPLLRKSVWLLCGLFLLWAINVGRLVLIFWAGHQFGQHFAINVLHPYVGLFTFNLGIVLMLLLLKPVGLRIGDPQASSWVPRGEVPPQRAAQSLSLAVPRVYSAVALVVVVGLFVSATNSHLKAYDLIASASGEPKLASYLENPASPAGWASTFSTEYDWARPYFGQSSSWYRFSYSPTLGNSDLHSTLPVIADVINTSDLSSFSAYGVEACYRFHGYTLHNISQVSLGGGISGQALSYTSVGAGHENWSIVYWVWPVAQGTTTRYERVILYILDTPGASMSAPGVTGVTNLQGTLDSTNADQRRLVTLRGFLVTFAREIIRAQSKVIPGTHFVKATHQVDEAARNTFTQRLAEHNKTATATTVPNKP